MKTSGFVLFGIVVLQLDQSTNLSTAFSAGAEEERGSGRKAPGICLQTIVWISFWDVLDPFLAMVLVLKKGFPFQSWCCSI